MIRGLDPGNLDPIEVPQNARALAQGNQTDSNKIRGYGIAP